MFARSGGCRERTATAVGWHPPSILTKQRRQGCVACVMDLPAEIADNNSVLTCNCICKAEKFSTIQTPFFMRLKAVFKRTVAVGNRMQNGFQRTRPLTGNFAINSPASMPSLSVLPVLH